jgi:phenylpyruvate tautomerase PptA (4-oxalocrotonate tautomerase family)
MPRIDVTLPYNSLSAQGKSVLANTLVEADEGQLTCGGLDLTRQALACSALCHFPAGVLDKQTRAQFVTLAHEAFKQPFGVEEKRTLMTSVIISDVADGHQGANGQVWELKDLAKAAGYVHLQHLVN